MDALNDSATQDIVAMCSAQVGKTELLLNIIAYLMHLDPSPMLALQPTLEMAEAFSKDRLAPMLRDTPALHGLVKDARSRDSGNTLLHKGFPGGHITLAGANSPSSLASRPIRVVLADEVDRYPASAGTEGDPVNLAKKRTTTFWNRKIVLSSTPTVKGFSRIEMAYEQSDKRRYWVPCPHCGAFQVLIWAQVRWTKDMPWTAHYICEHCNERITDAQKPAMLLEGEWRAEAPFNGIAGFHINELYSPWVRFGQTAANFLLAKQSKETLKTWVNTALGETFDDEGTRVDWEALLNRRESWGDSAPDDVLLVTAGVDIQDSRIEAELVGWGVGSESWSLGYKVFWGSPGEREVWTDLDAWLQQVIPSKAGPDLHVAAACIDTGGHHTQAVYDFCLTRFNRKVFAIKGQSQPGKPIVGRPTNNNRANLPLWPVGTDTAKEFIYSALGVSTPGHGYCHFPADREPEYFKQLTAERLVTRYVRGFPTQVWEKLPGARNEALDCRVYALAAFKILNVNMTAFAQQVRDTSPPPKPADPDHDPRGKPAWIQRKPGWIKR